MIRVSVGTSHVLGLSRGRLDAPPTTAYLLIGERCVRSCLFCPQARGASGRPDVLARVTWPEVDGRLLLRSLERACARGSFRRVCLQLVRSDGSMQEARRIVLALRDAVPTPISVSCHPASSAEIAEVASWGVSRVSVPLDAASPEIYARVKGGMFSRAAELVEQAGRVLPGRVGTHVVVGLGESEEEVVRLIQWLADRGVSVGLFAFTPVSGTPLAERRQPDIDSYRCVQAAAYLVARGLRRAESFSFRGGRIVCLGLEPEEVAASLGGGEAFRTSGCPDCNRPFYNERPGGTIYNYPRPLDEGEFQEALRRIIARTPGRKRGPLVEQQC